MNGGSSPIVAALRSVQICGTLCSCRATGRGWREANLIASHHPRRSTRRAGELLEITPATGYHDICMHAAAFTLAEASGGAGFSVKAFNRHLEVAPEPVR